MFSKLQSYALSGLNAYPIAIETFISGGLPRMTIVGLPDNAVNESRERVRASIKNCGFSFPPDRITTNLSPADLKKAGPAFDLPIALSILAATDQIPLEALEGYAFLGELSLEGKILGINGTLSIAIAAKDSGLKGLVIPSINAREASLAQSIPIYPADSLLQVIGFLSDKSLLKPYEGKCEEMLVPKRIHMMDFGDVKGQQAVKRGLEIAAAGGHNTLMVGPPGSGKTMLAKRIPSILPEMTLKEALQTTQIHSVAGLLRRDMHLIGQRPFRSPHHTASDIALIGGGPNAKPGEVSLAHNGVLFLDELPEFSRSVLEVLRQPLEDGFVTIARAKQTLTFPAAFMFVASLNPCPCGWLGDPRRECRCSALEIERYQHKLSGPLLDRIDIHLQVPALKPTELWSSDAVEHSFDIKNRTAPARSIQTERFKDTAISCNAHMNHAQLKEFCPLDSPGQNLLLQAMERLKLSARAHDKIIKVARTIADLEGVPRITQTHIAEAVGYRILDRMK